MEFMHFNQFLSNLAALPAFPTRLGAFFRALLVSPVFTYIAVPLFVSVGSAGLRMLARPNRKLELADALVAFDLGLGACVTLLVNGLVLARTAISDEQFSSGAAQDYLAGIFIILAIFVGALITVARLINERGWNQEKRSYKLIWIIGADIFGLLLLIGAFAVTGGGSQ